MIKIRTDSIITILEQGWANSMKSQRMLFVSKGLIMIILVGIIMMMFSSCGRLICVNNDFEAYSSDESEFKKIAETVLPNNDFLQEEQILFWEYSFDFEKTFEIYRFAVCYNDTDFNQEKERLQKQYNENASRTYSNNPNVSDDDFYFDGVRYYCYTFYTNGMDYAMAYVLSEEVNTVSYIFFKDEYGLPTMHAGAALSLFYTDGNFQKSSKHIVSEVV